MIGSIRWTAIKLGIFTIVTIVVTTWLASIIGNFQLFEKPYEVTAEFTDVTGLLQGDVVKAAGVTVGRVESIAVEDGVARVTMSLDEGVQIPEGVRAQVRFRNLIGQRLISFAETGNSGGPGMLEPGDVIPLERTDPAFDLSLLFNGLRPLIRSTEPADINIVARALVEGLKGREDELSGFLSNVADISTTLATKDTEIGVLLTNLNEVTGDLAGRGQQLNSTLADLNTFFGAIQESEDDLEGALVSLDDAATSFDRIIAKNDENIEAELDDLQVLLDAVDDKRGDLRAALRSLPEFLEAVQRVNSYGQWGNAHLVDVCKDDLGTCGSRWMP